MTLIDTAVALRDRLTAIPIRFGVVTYIPVTVVRTDGVYLITPTPIVTTAAAPGTSVPGGGGTTLGIPGTLSVGGLTLKTEAVIIKASRANPYETLNGEGVIHYIINGVLYTPLTISRNNNLYWEIMAQQKVDRR